MRATYSIRRWLVMSAPVRSHTSHGMWRVVADPMNASLLPFFT